MSRPHVPDDVLALAHARKRAREARDWPEADRLKASIEAAGWKVVDRGTDFSLAPAHPPDVEEAGRVRYGRSESVPSRLAEPTTAFATVVLRATDWPDDVGRALDAVARTVPDGTQVVVVADDPSAGQAAALEAVPSGTEVVWTSSRLGEAAALNAGIRRGAGPVVVVLDASVEPAGDVVSPLVRALDDPTAAVAGPWGFASRDLRSFHEVESGDADAIGGYMLAFRRADYVDRGPLDEKFRFYRNLDIWWSLVLRDGGEGGRHRRAVVVPGLPVVRHEHRGWTSAEPAERDRLSKRNFYRIIDRFGPRRDLATGR